MHVFFWVVMFGSYYYFNTISFNPARGTPATYLLALHNAVSTATAFYSLMYFIWPQFLAKRKWIPGLFFLVVWVFAMAALVSFGDWLIFNRCQSCGERLAQYSPDYYQFLQRNFPSIVFVRVMSGGLLYQLIVALSLPIAIKLGRSYFRQTIQQLQLSQDNLRLEFNFLKSQLNPHFLFNTLNNIYSLVVAQRNEQAAATLSRLSGFMRYTLYETGEEKILLQKEMQLLEDYIELEKLRLNETEVQFQFTADREDYTLPPLLFMPALENAFKYSVDKKGSRIHITIRAVQGQLAVDIENSFDPERISATGGIGLQNLQRRVLHYYGRNALYSVSEKNAVYLFQLHFPLV